MNHRLINKLYVASFIISLIGMLFPVKILAEQVPPLLITEINHIAASNEEWLEIKNNTETELDLDKLKFIENNIKHKITHPTRTSIKAGEVIIIANDAALTATLQPAHKEQVFDSSWQNLSLEGETIAIEYDETVYDQIFYPKVNTSTPATKSLQRTSDLNFILADLTPFLYDIVAIDSWSTSPNNTSIKNQPLIALITEINLNSTNGYIEIYIAPAKSNLPLNLENWQLLTKNFSYKLGNETLTSGEYYLIPYAQNGLTTDLIQLLNSEEDIVDEFCWSKSSSDNCNNLTDFKNNIIGRTSFFDTNSLSDWDSFERATPAAANEHKNYSPVAKITIQEGSLTNQDQVNLKLDAGSSSDPDQDPLTYSWYLNNKLQTTTAVYSPQINSIGKHLITLTVSDQFNASAQSHLQLEVAAKSTATVIPQTVQPCKQSSNTTTTINTASNISSQQQSGEQNLSTKIAIHSFLANPLGSDTNNEWIKIINNDNQTISLTNWQLDDEDGGSKAYTISDILIAPGEIINFSNSDTKINLNNNGDDVRLIDPQGSIVSEFTYEKADDDEIIATGIATISSNNNSDNKTASTGQKLVAATTAKTKTVSQPAYLNGNTSNEIRISEIFPNPKGSDNENEWLEFENTGAKDVNLGNWYLKIKDKEYKLPSTITIAANSQYQFNPAEIKLTLTNSNTQIDLLDFNNELKQSISYEKTKEAQAYSLILDERQSLLASLNPQPSGPTWQWTKHLTPGKQNPKLITLKGLLTESQSGLVNNQLALKNNNQQIHINFETAQIAASQLSLLTTNSQIILEVLAIGQEYFLEKIINIVAPIKAPAKATGAIISLILLLVFCIAIFAVPYTRRLIMEQIQTLWLNIRPTKSSA